MTTVAILATIAAENGDYRCQKWRQFVAFLATIVTVIVAKNGIVENGQVFENFEWLYPFQIESNSKVSIRIF